MKNVLSELLWDPLVLQAKVGVAVREGDCDGNVSVATGHPQSQQHRN
jgi:hypothetical protein